MPLLNSAIYDVIAKYEEAKGTGRWLLKAEPHMKQLSSFAKKTLNMDLSDLKKAFPPNKVQALSAEDLVKLAEILLEKNKRDSVSESGKAFNKLADHFGGFPALDLLKSYGKVVPGFVVFLIENSANALPLLRALLDFPLEPLQLSSFMALTDGMEAQDKLDFYEYLKKQCKENKSVFRFEPYANMLLFLNQQKLKIPGLGKLLASASKLDAIFSVLFYLAPSTEQEKKTETEAKSVVFDAALVAKVLALQSPLEFGKNLKLVELSVANLDLLFAADSFLHTHQWAEEILKNFKQGGWVVSPYLKRILLEITYGLNITRATDILIKNPKLITSKASDAGAATPPIENSPQLIKILDCIFKNPKNSELFAQALQYLHEKTSGLAAADLDILIGVSDNPVKVAEAMVMLRHEGITDMRRVIAHPSHAVDIATFEREVSRWKTKLGDRYPWASIVTHVLANPESVQFILPVLKFCVEQQLSSAKVLAISKAKLTSEGLSQLLITVNSIPNLLAQINLESVAGHVKYIKTLLSATICLKQGGKLDKDNFESLLTNPALAISAAKTMGGKAKSAANPPQIEPGAKNVSDLRAKAALLAIGQKKNLFFKPPTTTEKYPAKVIADHFQLKRRTTLEQAKKDLLIKIVEMSGELHGKNVLEPEVLHEEVTSSFNEYYGKK